MPLFSRWAKLRYAIFARELPGALHARQTTAIIITAADTPSSPSIHRRSAKSSPGHYFRLKKHGDVSRRQPRTHQSLTASASAIPAGMKRRLEISSMQQKLPHLLTLTAIIESDHTNNIIAPAHATRHAAMSTRKSMATRLGEAT